MKLFNARTQQQEDAVMTVDANNEIVATFADDSFVKFPAGLSQEEFTTLVNKHQEDNEGQEVITPEVQAKQEQDRAASLALIGQTTQEQEDKTNASTPTDDNQVNPA